MSKLSGYEREIERKDILSVQINLLNRCTSRCLSCRKYTWPKDELALEDIKKTLKVLKSKGLQTVVFSGGDPILYKHMRDVIDTCLELGIKYSVITTLITKNEEILKYIARTAYRIHVSIDSSSRALYTFIRGVDGLPTAMQNLELVQGIRNQYKNMIPVRVSMTVGNLNYQEVYKMYQNVVVKNGCLLNYYMLHTWDDLKINEEERKLLEYNLGKVAKEDEPGKTNAKSLLFNLEPNHKGSGCKCYLPYINATINANGDIYPCCKLLDDNGDYGKQLKYAYGNVADKTEEEIAKEFDKRLDLHYPQSVICRECAQRYDGMISDLEKVFDKSKREVVFL